MRFLLLGLLLGMFCFGLPVLAQERTPKVQKFSYDPGGRRDPFSALVRGGKLVGVEETTQEELTKPILYGILWDPGGRSIALINDAELKIGDTIGGYTLVDIQKNSVTMDLKGKRVIMGIAFETVGAKPSVDKKKGAKGGEGS